ncbi:MAG: hypothetical protein O7G85_01715 [Planctomycetota bacterium]|nr:hypothetical protein [Planctomycetota bacterium]
MKDGSGVVSGLHHSRHRGCHGSTGQLLMTPQDAIEFVAQHGIILESAKGSVPNLADTVAGEAIKGSYWGHPRGDEIFMLTRAIRSSEEILVCRLVNGKVTYVHRRLWDSIFRLQDCFEKEDLGAIKEIHSSFGHHKLETIPFPEWVPNDIEKDAERLTFSQAASALGEWFDASSIDRPERHTR